MHRPEAGESPSSPGRWLPIHAAASGPSPFPIAGSLAACWRAHRAGRLDRRRAARLGLCHEIDIHAGVLATTGCGRLDTGRGHGWPESACYSIGHCWRLPDNSETRGMVGWDANAQTPDRQPLTVAWICGVRGWAARDPPAAQALIDAWLTAGPALLLAPRGWWRGQASTRGGGPPRVPLRGPEARDRAMSFRPRWMWREVARSTGSGGKCFGTLSD